jgi:hypothetical protein
MKHHISFNEIISTVTKALCAMGFPPGFDQETAKNIAWLEARKLGGIAALVSEIEKIKNLDQWPIVTTITTQTNLTITSSLQSGLLLAQVAIDFAESGKTILIKKCTAPLFIFAEAARRARVIDGFIVNWKIGKFLFEGICQNGQVKISKKLDGFQSLGDILIRLERCDNLLDDHNSRPVCQVSLSEGIVVDAQSWFQITSIARNTLVPSSEHSRSNAGAEVDDST